MSIVHATGRAWGFPSIPHHRQHHDNRSVGAPPRTDTSTPAVILLGPLLIDGDSALKTLDMLERSAFFDGEGSRTSIMLESPSESTCESLDSLFDTFISHCSSSSDDDELLDAHALLESASRKRVGTNNESRSRTDQRQHRRRVSFSDTVHVRTHSIVVGDHPCCRQLALELGWEHNNESLINMEEWFHRKNSRKKKRNAGSEDPKKKTNRATESKLVAPAPPRRRSYWERKSILKEVGGMTDEDIHQATLRRAFLTDGDLSAMQQRMMIRRRPRSQPLFEPLQGATGPTSDYWSC